MNKKAIYMAPAIELSGIVEEENLLTGTVGSVGGDAGISKGEGETPGVADARQLLFFSVFE